MDKISNLVNSLEVKLLRSSRKQIYVSYILTIHNHGTLISKILEDLNFSVTINSELIVFFDCCKDNSFQLFLSNYHSLSKLFIKVTYIKSRFNFFETKSDKTAANLAAGNYILHLQGDMILRDKGVDRRFIEAFSTYPDIFCFSGRGADLFTSINEFAIKSVGTDLVSGKSIILWAAKKYISQFIIKNKSNSVQKNCKNNISDFSFLKNGKIGFIDQLPEKINYAKPQKKIYLSHTVMRGPLVFRKDYAKSLNFFDDKSFFQGFDDHDLMLRAWITKGLRCGYLPMIFISPREFAVTAKRRSFISIARIAIKSFFYKKRFHLSFLFLFFSFCSKFGIMLDEKNKLLPPLKILRF
jgi:hypothetical protein